MTDDQVTLEARTRQGFEEYRYTCSGCGLITSWRMSGNVEPWTAAHLDSDRHHRIVEARARETD